MEIVNRNDSRPLQLTDADLEQGLRWQGPRSRLRHSSLQDGQHRSGLHEDAGPRFGRASRLMLASKKLDAPG
jgi:hypothetical protein